MISLDILGSILTAVNLFVDLWVGTLIYDTLFERKREKKRFWAMFLLMYVAYFLIINYSPWFHGTSVRKVIFVFVVFYLLALVEYQGHPIKKLFCAIGYEIINYIVNYTLVIFLMMILNVSQPELFASPSSYSAMMFFYMLILFLMVAIFRKLRKSEKRKENVPVAIKEWMGFLMMPLCSIITLIILVDSSIRENTISLWLLIDCILLLAANIGQVVLQDKMEEERQAATEAKILAQNAQSAMDTAVALNNAYTQQRALVHDFRNQLQIMEELLRSGSVEEARSYLQTLASSVSVTVIVVSTNNPFVDAVLNQKYHAAKQAGVTMMFQINDLADLPIEDKDIVTILANVLDNAIEAAAQVEDGDRYISVKFQKSEEETILSVRNTMRGTAHIVDNMVATTKTHSEEHGYGLPNVRRTLEKYGLDYVVCSKEGWFQFTTILS